MNNKVKLKSYSSSSTPKGWGSEELICNNEEYCGKILRFNEGAKFSMHYHVKKRETFFVQSGLIELTTINLENSNKTTFIFGVGCIIEIPRLVPHQIFALQESSIIEFSTHHEESDSYRILPGDSQLK